MIMETMSVRMASARFLERSWPPAIPATRCFSAMVTGAATFVAMSGPPRFRKRMAWESPRRLEGAPSPQAQVRQAQMIRAAADYAAWVANRANWEGEFRLSH